MDKLHNKVQLGELANIKSQFRVTLNVRTKPENLLLNANILGVISKVVGNVGQLASSASLISEAEISYLSFMNIYAQIIAPSISDKGSVESGILNNKFFVLFNNCNNIARVFSENLVLTNIHDTNISLKLEIPLSDYTGQQQVKLFKELINDLGLV